MFRHALKRSRVLVPASGFYEWVPVAGYRQPYFIWPVGGEALFGFGGLLKRWEGAEGPALTFAIRTSAANDLVQPIHDRMPVIVRSEDYAAWLDPGVTDAHLVRAPTGEYPAAAMEAYSVGRAVGNLRSQGPDLVEPIGRSWLHCGYTCPRMRNASPEGLAQVLENTGGPPGSRTQHQRIMSPLL
tara:strand:+ start:12438 stop:12992 length:555 start_codon:yes stop_codon:yes gene_type:complete